MNHRSDQGERGVSDRGNLRACAALSGGSRHTDPVGNSWTRFAALGDSITEGWCDPVVGDSEPWFGWADRLALHIDLVQRSGGATHRLEYANLAVRGRRIRHVVDDQIPEAIRMRADLVSVLIGGNDLSSMRVDPDSLTAQLEPGIAALRASGADVLLATVYNPTEFSPHLRVLRGRAAVFTANIHAIARRHGCRVLDLWAIPGLDDRGMWSADRMHPSARGHLALLDAACAALGLPAPSQVPTTAPRHVSTLAWLREHALPWVLRRLRGVSSGDGLGPKIPAPHPIGVLRDDDPGPEVAPHAGTAPSAPSVPSAASAPSAPSAGSAASAPSAPSAPYDEARAPS